MLLLPKNARDNIVSILKSQVAPAETGFNLIQVARVLENLEMQEVSTPNEETNDKKSNDEN